MQNRRCGGCGYDLMGIARTGQCPECGRRYDISSGQGTDARKKPWLEVYAKTALLFVFAGVIAVCSGAIAMTSLQPGNVLLGGGAITGVVLLVAFYNYYSERQIAQEEDEANQ